MHFEADPTKHSPGIAAEIPGSAETQFDTAYRFPMAQRAFFREAYLDAVVPDLAACVGHHQQLSRRTEVRVLVIGGGDGHFSREVAPALQNLLTSRIIKNSPRLKITESDLFQHSRQNPETFIRADLCALQDTFAPDSFDLIVGENCLHHVGPRNMELAFTSMKAILRSGGLIWHVTDAIPDPKVYAPAALQRAASHGVRPEGAKLSAGDIPQTPQALAVEKIAIAAREGLFNALREGSRQARLKHLALAEIEGSFFLPDSLNRPYPEPTSPVLQYRSILYRHGQSAIEVNPPLIPNGVRKLTYIGRRLLVGALPVAAIDAGVCHWRDFFRTISG